MKSLLIGAYRWLIGLVVAHPVRVGVVAALVLTVVWVTSCAPLPGSLTTAAVEAAVVAGVEVAADVAERWSMDDYCDIERDDLLAAVEQIHALAHGVQARVETDL